MAQYEYDRYLASGLKDDQILLARIRTVHDLETVINTYRKVRDISYVTHGNVTILNGMPASQIDALNIAPYNDKGITMTLNACLTGKGDSPIAQNVSDKLGVTVVAPAAFVTPSKIDGAPTTVSEYNALKGYLFTMWTWNTFTPKE